MRYLLLLTGFFCVFASSGQDLHYKNYDWESPTKPSILTGSDTAELEIILFEKRAVEFNFGPDNNLYEYYLFHSRVKVNSDDAIERNNKIYLPLRADSEVLLIKARSISKDGKVKELDQDDVIESKDEKDGRVYKYFALEGIEKGSEVEQLFLLKRSPRITGNGFTFQSGIKRKNVSFELISPSFLPCKFKSMNGFPELKTDTTVNDRYLYKAELKDVPALKEEKFAAYDPHKMGVVYKVHGNKNTGATNLFNYSRISESVYEDVYKNYDKTKKLISKFVKKIEINSADSEERKILKVEDYIKTNVLILDTDIPAFGDIKTILGTSIEVEGKKKKMIASNNGALKLFAHVFTFLGIEHQVVMTSNRFDQRFDKDFEAYNYLNENLLYFPGQKMLISPTDMFTRSRFIPQGCYNTYGLFVVPVTAGTFKSAIAKVNFIPPLPETANTDSLFLNCSFKTDNNKLAIDYKRTATGYYAMQYQPFYDVLDKEMTQDFEKNFTSFLTDNSAEVKSFKVDNVGSVNIGKPLVTDAVLECEKFVEIAGDKYVVKVGELIGPQAELYQEEKRKLPVENGFNRLYYRKIVFTVPDGYILKDPAALKMEHKHTDEKGLITMEFKSDYIMEENRLIINCTEYYRQIDYPVELFEEFRKVINAAADFNKVALILEKK